MNPWETSHDPAPRWSADEGEERGSGALCGAVAVAAMTPEGFTGLHKITAKVA